MSTETPEFVLWTIQHGCDLRDELVNEPCEKIWRHLRPLHAYSRGKEEDRIFEGICVQKSADQIENVDDRSLGFRVDEVLDYYGGLEYVSQQCIGCKANAAAKSYDHGLAGCVGIFREDATKPGLSDFVGQAVEKLGLKTKIEKYCFESVKPWYAIWNGTSQNDQLDLLNDIFAHISLNVHNWNEELEHARREVDEFIAALKICQQSKLQMQCELFPGGNAVENIWTVSSHCYDCLAPMSEDARKCDNCGRVGCCHPSRKRKSRGERPFWPLSGFSGSEGATEFLRRYRASLRVE